MHGSQVWQAETGLSLSDSDGEDLGSDLCDASGNDKFVLKIETDKESEDCERRSKFVFTKQAKTKVVQDSDNEIRHSERDCDKNVEEKEKTTLQRTGADETSGMYFMYFGIQVHASTLELTEV